MTARLSRELKDLAEKGRLKSFSKTKELSAVEVQYRGRRVIDFSSWDYLSIRSHPKIKAALHAAVEASGASVPSPRLASGTRLSHLLLEERLAKFHQLESALLFSSRNQAAFTLFASVLTEADTIFIEESANAPAFDAAFLVGASAQYFSMESSDWPKRLEDGVKKGAARGSVYIFCETLSPYSGNLAPLESIFSVAQSGALLVFDDTYALGGLGIRGAGVTELAPLKKDRLLAVIGSFGYGLPGFGGYIAGSKEVVGYLVNRSRTVVTEPPLPDHVSASAEASIEIAEVMHHQREQLLTRADDIAKKLKECGYRTGYSGTSPVVTASFQKPSEADELCRFLLEKGVLVQRVPRGTFLDEKSAVRFVINSGHGDLEYSTLFAAFESSARVR